MELEVARMSFANLEVFFGQATESSCRVYARLPEAPPGVELAGTIRGPQCKFAQTLPASYPLRSLGSKPSPLAEALLLDPCYWTPDGPQIYEVDLELRQGEQVLERTQRLLGIRPFGAAGKSFRQAKERWVLRGVNGCDWESNSLEDWRSCSASLHATEPDDGVCEAASWLGVMIVAHLNLPVGRSVDWLQARLRNLARWPAVAMVTLPATASAPVGWQPPATNLILAQRFLADEPVSPASWAQVAVCQVDTPANFSVRTQSCQLPIIAWRPFDDAVNVAQARAACDDLQRDLAPYADLAGYLV